MMQIKLAESINKDANLVRTRNSNLSRHKKEALRNLQSHHPE